LKLWLTYSKRTSRLRGVVGGGLALKIPIKYLFAIGRSEGKVDLKSGSD
jgi:hypothetical protein